MAGIFGVLGASLTDDDHAHAAAMGRAMSHEASVQSGLLVDRELGVAAGSVSGPGSLTCHLPLWNRAGDTALIWFGEDYSSAGAPLERPGGEGSLAVAERLLRGYERMGESWFRALNGWFAGIVLDRRLRRAMIFNDRFGLGRLYVHESAGRLFFATEAKAILSCVGRPAQWDWRSVGEFVELGCVLQHRTLFEGIALLPPASLVVHTPDGRQEARRFFDVAEWSSRSPLSRLDYEHELLERFPGIVNRYLREPDQLAISLTGGVDSRMILASLPPDHHTVPCYTFRSSFRDSRDVSVARAVAAASGHRHLSITLGGDFARAFPHLAARAVFLTDGAIDASGAADLYVNEAAAKVRPIRLTGNYGGEILRAMVAFAPQRLHRALFQPEFAALLARARDTYREERGAGGHAFVASKQLPWHHFGRFALERSAVCVRSPFLDNDVVSLAFRAPADAEDSHIASLHYTRSRRPGLAELPTDRGRPLAGGLGIRRAANWMHTLLLRAEYAYDYAMPDALARFDAALRWLGGERLFLGRHKFHHFRLWYRDTLAPHVRDMLLGGNGAMDNVAPARAIESAVRDHVSGRANYTREIHKLLAIRLVDDLLMKK